MNYWLVKSEPSAYSWEQFVEQKKTSWTGVRSYAGRLHLRNMKKNDHVLWYRSNEGKDVIAIASVVKEAYPDPTATEGDWSTVDLSPLKKLKKFVSLDSIKKHKLLKNMALVRIGRLSVSPVTEKEYNTLIELSETR